LAAEHVERRLAAVLAADVAKAIDYGEGERFDAPKGWRKNPVPFVMVPANQLHFVWTENEDAR
jgi:hypothetical protein